jgi:hypothetical protein
MVQLLCIALFLWRPLDFAIELLQTLPSLAMRGARGAIELLFHGVVAAIAMAAIRALWAEVPAARRLAAVAVMASALASVQSLYWSVLPRQTMPGDERWLAILAIIHAAFWLAWLKTSRRFSGG